MWINPHLPEHLDLHAYLRNTSGAKWMVKIRHVGKTHPRSSSCQANPVTKPLVSSKDALVTSCQAPRRSCEAFTNSWVAQPGVGPAWSRASQESGKPVVSSASAYRHHPEPECLGTFLENISQTYAISKVPFHAGRARGVSIYPLLKASAPKFNLFALRTAKEI